MFMFLDVRRYLLAGVFAAVITAVLILVMHFAIHTDDPGYEEVATLPLPPWAPEIDEIPPEVRPPLPEPIDLPTPPPQLITPTIDPGVGDVLITVGPTEPPPQDQGGGFGNPDGEFTPIMTIPPEYPTRALAQGLEGWVVVEFTVDSIGRVASPRVLDAHPGSVFNKAALKAIKRYKYKPRVVDGEPQAVPGVRQRIVFNTSA